mmetsp:Transcript_27273/g.91241  ORF Transcript_27273/g.91241 Transcript_27273/m.91241 type:complete len:209 (-) Transcript_27273:288-914(-)
MSSSAASGSSSCPSSRGPSRTGPPGGSPSRTASSRSPCGWCSSSWRRSLPSSSGSTARGGHPWTWLQTSTGTRQCSRPPSGSSRGAARWTRCRGRCCASSRAPRCSARPRPPSPCAPTRFARPPPTASSARSLRRGSPATWWWPPRATRTPTPSCPRTCAPPCPWRRTAPTSTATCSRPQSRASPSAAPPPGALPRRAHGRPGAPLEP